VIHLTERDVLELRDNSLVDADVREHLDTCIECQATMAAARARQVTIRDALSALDQPVDVEEAKARIRARLSASGSQAASGVRSRVRRWSLGKAAALLLVGAGAASAIPGSPVRNWLSPNITEEVPSELEAVTSGPELVGGSLTVTEGPLTVELIEVPAQTRVTVLWVSGSTATVRAAPGSGFSYGEGGINASIAGGPVSVELPRAVTSVSLAVNGRMYMQAEDGVMDATGPVQERDGDVITFIVGG
jgi:anti-sigma factor RsiW